MSNKNNKPETNKSDIVDLNQYRFDQIEKELRVKLSEYTEKSEIHSQIGEAFYIWKNNPDLLPEDLAMDEIDESTFSRFFDWFLYDYKLLDSGKTVVSTFYKESSKELNAIEKTILKKAQSSICSFYILEEIVGEEQCIISDIFTNKKYTINDKSTATKAKTYNILGARILISDNNLFFSDVITIYPIAYKSLILDFFKKEYKEYEKTVSGKPSTNKFLKDWGYLIFQYLENVSKNPRFLNSDGEVFTFIISEYKVLNYEEALNSLEQTDNFALISKENDDLKIFTITSKNNLEIVGMAELDNKMLNLECYSHSTQTKIKELLDENFSNTLKHKKDSVRDLNMLLDTSNHNKKHKVDRLPPGVKNRTEMDSILDNYYEEWLDLPLEILDGKSPLQASETKLGKNQLHTILRELEELYEIAKQRGEPYYNINILRNKLNL